MEYLKYKGRTIELKPEKEYNIYKRQILLTERGINMPLNVNITYVWLAMAVVLGLVEIFTTTLVCIWFVIGSLFAFGVSFMTDSIILQLLVFVAVSGVSLAVTRPLVAKHLNRNVIPTNADMLIGKVCTVIQPITPQEKGRVTVDGQSWMAASTVALEPGQQAVIERISGVTLTVAPQTTKIG